jgi:hypothetical protein
MTEDTMHNFFRTLAPERFDANVAIYASIQACRAGFLKAQIEAQLKNAAMQLLKEGFSQANYVGRGHYDVTLSRAIVGGLSSYFPSRRPYLRSGLATTARFSSWVRARM